MAVNYTRLQALAKRLIEENGRQVTLNKLAPVTPADTNKPWRSKAAPRDSLPTEQTVNVIAVFLDTISSRYLGITIQADGTEDAEAKYVMIATTSAPDHDLRSFNELVDETEVYKITTLNVLHPGSDEIFVAFKAQKRKLFE
jgi:hypothetical protein